MITVSLSEGVAFDMYAIARVKEVRTGLDACHTQVNSLCIDLLRALDAGLLADILCSAEYKALYEANGRVFDLIEEMHRTPKLSHGMAIDRANHQRYLAKVALQNRWFPETPIGEVKIGYGDAPPVPNAAPVVSTSST